MRDLRKHRADEHHEQQGDDDQAPAIPADARLRVSAARRWAIGHGRTLSTPALAAIVGAKLDRSEPFDVWTADVVSELLWTDIVTWCQGRGAACPQRVAETLWTYLTFLADEAAMAPGSDALAQLRAPLLAVGGLNRDGRQRVNGRRAPAERPRQSAQARTVPRLAPVVPLRRSRPG